MNRPEWEYIGRVPIPALDGRWHECYLFRNRFTRRLHYVDINKFWGRPMVLQEPPHRRRRHR